MCRALLGLWCFLGISVLAHAQDSMRMTRMTCGYWLTENPGGYAYMVEGYLLGLYQVQSLTGNPSGSFYKVSTKELPNQIKEVCQKNPQANVGEIAITIKSTLDQPL